LPDTNSMAIRTYVMVIQSEESCEMEYRDRDQLHHL
jgi:hypothetical protein